MKVCFFSDIHGNGRSFKAFKERIECQNADVTVFGGDVLGYYYDAEEILNCLRNSDYICLLGNHDKMFLDLIEGKTNENILVNKYGNSYLNIRLKISNENIAFLRKLSPSYEMTLPNGKRLGFFHGSPSAPLDMRIYPDTIVSDVSAFEKYDYVFCGHTHHKLIKHIGSCTLINPGSAGQQRDGKGTSYCLFDTETERISIESFPYDKESLIREIEERETNENMRKKLIEVILRRAK